MAVINHNCTHPDGDRGAKFQESQLGRGKRYANPTNKDNPPKYTCTVCGEKVDGSYLARP